MKYKRARILLRLGWALIRAYCHHWAHGPTLKRGLGSCTGPLDTALSKLRAHEATWRIQHIYLILIIFIIISIILHIDIL